MIYYLLTEKIISGIYEVHNQLGPGLLEKPYHRALELALNKRQLSVESEKYYDVLFDGESVGHYKADLVIDNTVIVEVKAVKELEKNMFAQTINYLKVSRLPLGLLVNFRNASVEFRRFDNKTIPE